MKARLQVLAGEPSRDMMRSLAKKGPEPLAESERRRLALDKPLGAALDEAALSELEASHCGVVPKSAFGTMAYAQRYRDAHLADATLSAAVSGGSAVLITGNNHVRLDRGGGVPWYLRQRAPEIKVVTVMLAEVREGENDPVAYIPPRSRRQVNCRLRNPDTPGQASRSVRNAQECRLIWPVRRRPKAVTFPTFKVAPSRSPRITAQNSIGRFPRPCVLLLSCSHLRCPRRRFLPMKSATRKSMRLS